MFYNLSSLAELRLEVAYTSDKLHHFKTVMNEELKFVFEYCIINKLPMNLAKTNYMLISSSRSSGSINLVHNIECKNRIKYLGVYIDQNLHRGPQIQHINNKLAKNVGIINKLRYYVDCHTLRQLYFSFIYPYITYGITSWGSACKTRLYKIKTKLNRYVRSRFFANSRDNAVPYFSLLEFLSLENIYKFKVTFFKYKIINNTSNVPTLTPASEVHSYNTKVVSNHNLYRPRIRNSYGAATFAFAGCKVWENIPSKLKTLPYNTFYQKYKLYLLSTQ